MKGTVHWFEKDDRPTERYRKVGRPEFWTQEKIDDMIVDLEEWAQKKTSVCMAGFRADYYLCKDQIQTIKEKSPEFSIAYSRAQTKVGERLAQQTGKGSHPAVFNKYAPVYDKDLKDHEIEMIKIKSKADAAGQPLSLDQIKKLYAEGKLTELID